MKGGARGALWRLLAYGRPHLRPLVLAFACMAVLGLATGAFAYLMGPALRFLLTGGGQGLGSLEQFSWVRSGVGRSSLMWAFPAALVVIGAVKGVAYLGQFYWMGLFGQRVAMEVRRALFARLLSLSPGQRSQNLTGDLLSRFSADVGAVELAATYTVGSYVRDGLQVAILFGVTVALDWRVAVGAALIVPIAAWPVARLTRSFMGRTREGQARLGDLAGQVQEGLGGLRTIQAFNGQAAELLRFDQHAASHQRAVTRAAWARGGVPALMEILAAAAVAAGLGFAASTRAVAPDQLVSLLAAIVLMYQPVKDLGRVGQFALQAAVAGERIFAVLDAPQAVSDRPGARALGPVTGAVALRQVRFAYGQRPALEGVELEIPVGQVTALVGPSGSGKSTVAALLTRFERPASGQILIDGVDVEGATLESVRAQFAVVTQEPLLFSATVADNLRVGNPGATDAQLESAARLANADGFIRQLPRGYQTPVGERGVVLSGGQKQRLCIARALVAQAPVLILDEATSSLDPQSEAEVQAALDRVLPGRTALVIAHRLTTVAGADRICVLEKGQVTEVGTHAELLQRGGLYAKLWALQQQPEASVA